MPKVSVIIPVYNKEKYIKTTLNSVLNQEFCDFEIIAVNDGSTDRSGDILKEIARQDRRLKIINIANGGVSHARNIGLRNVAGEYITFVDADDWVDARFIGNLYHCICESGADMVISGIRKYWAHKKQSEYVSVVASRLGMCSKNEMICDFVEEQQRCGIYGNCVAKIFPKRFADHICFDESLTLAEDFDFYLKMYSIVDSVYFDDKEYYYYLQEAENSTGKCRDSEIDYISQIIINQRYCAFLKKYGQFSGKNRKIIDRKISDDIFAGLYHSMREDFNWKYNQIRLLYEMHPVGLCKNDLRKKVVLTLFEKDYKRSLYQLLRIVRLAKYISKR